MPERKWRYRWEVEPLCFSANGKYLLAEARFLGDQQSMLVICVETDQVVFQSPRVHSCTGRMAMTPDASLAAIATPEHETWVYDVPSAMRICVLPDTNIMALAPSNRLICTTDSRSHRLKVWPVKPSAVPIECNVQTLITHLCVSSNSRMVACSTSANVCICDTGTAQLITVVLLPSENPRILYLDSTTLLTSTYDRYGCIVSTAPSWADGATHNVTHAPYELQAKFLGRSYMYWHPSVASVYKRMDDGHYRFVIYGLASGRVLHALPKLMYNLALVSPTLTHYALTVTFGKSDCEEMIIRPTPLLFGIATFILASRRKIRGGYLPPLPSEVCYVIWIYFQLSL
jgi:hypothetical protein